MFLCVTHFEMQVTFSYKFERGSSILKNGQQADLTGRGGGGQFIEERPFLKGVGSLSGIFSPDRDDF